MNITGIAKYLGPFTISQLYFHHCISNWIFALIWSITNAAYDVHQHLKEVVYKIITLLPPGDQTAKYKFKMST